jgi:hypothetical protein
MMIYKGKLQNLKSAEPSNKKAMQKLIRYTVVLVLLFSAVESKGQTSGTDPFSCEGTYYAPEIPGTASHPWLAPADFQTSGNMSLHDMTIMGFRLFTNTAHTNTEGDITCYGPVTISGASDSFSHNTFPLNQRNDPNSDCPFWTAARQESLYNTVTSSTSTASDPSFRHVYMAIRATGAMGDVEPEWTSYTSQGGCQPNKNILDNPRVQWMLAGCQVLSIKAWPPSTIVNVNELRKAITSSQDFAYRVLSIKGQSSGKEFAAAKTGAINPFPGLTETGIAMDGTNSVTVTITWEKYASLLSSSHSPWTMDQVMSVGDTRSGTDGFTDNLDNSTIVGSESPSLNCFIYRVSSVGEDATTWVRPPDWPKGSEYGSSPPAAWEGQKIIWGHAGYNQNIPEYPGQGKIIYQHDLVRPTENGGHAFDGVYRAIDFRDDNGNWTAAPHLLHLSGEPQWDEVQTDPNGIVRFDGVTWRREADFIKDPPSWSALHAPVSVGDFCSPSGQVTPDHQGGPGQYPAINWPRNASSCINQSAMVFRASTVSATTAHQAAPTTSSWPIDGGQLTDNEVVWKDMGVNGADVDLRAGRVVHLYSGFHAEQGCRFHAYIAPSWPVSDPTTAVDEFTGANLADYSGSRHFAHWSIKGSSSQITTGSIDPSKHLMLQAAVNANGLVQIEIDPKFPQDFKGPYGRYEWICNFPINTEFINQPKDVTEQGTAAWLWAPAPFGTDVREGLSEEFDTYENAEWTNYMGYPDANRGQVGTDVVDRRAHCPLRLAHTYLSWQNRANGGGASGIGRSLTHPTSYIGEESKAVWDIERLPNEVRFLLNGRVIQRLPQNNRHNLLADVKHPGRASFIIGYTPTISTASMNVQGVYFSDISTISNKQAATAPKSTHVSRKGNFDVKVNPSLMTSSSRNLEIHLTADSAGPAEVSGKVYDILGRTVFTICDQVAVDPIRDLRVQLPVDLASGSYYCKFTFHVLGSSSDAAIITRKIQLRH